MKLLGCDFIQLPNFQCMNRCGFQQEGCEYSEGPDQLATLLFDGIMGLSKKTIAALPYQLHEQGLIRQIVAYCLLPNSAKVTNNVAGYLMFGEGKKLKMHTLTWTPMSTRPDATK